MPRKFGSSKPTPGFDFWQKASNGDGTYKNPETGEPINFKTRDWELYGETRQQTSGTIASAEDQLLAKGYKRVAMGVPCPIAGSEGGTCYYEVDGKRAIWDSGNVYMRK